MGRVKVRYGYHLVTDCRKANQGKSGEVDSIPFSTSLVEMRDLFSPFG
jgi:hypothetical protein